MTRKCRKIAFFCISCIEHPYKGRFTKTWLIIPSISLHVSKPRFFWTSRPICWILKSHPSSPLGFFFQIRATLVNSLFLVAQPTRFWLPTWRKKKSFFRAFYRPNRIDLISDKKLFIYYLFILNRLPCFEAI